MNTALSQKIYDMAIECGFDNCAILPLDELNIEKFEERLALRTEKIPQSEQSYRWMKNFSKIKEIYPWAESVIVCINYMGKYRYPQSLQKKYAKAYMLSVHTAHGSPEHKNRIRFEEWFSENDICFSGGEDASPGYMFPLRHAAVEAGMGIFRKNNFFYSEKGSFYEMEGYIIDKKCRYTHNISLKPCPPNCSLCRDICGTHSLSDEYMMNPATCVSNLNTFAGENIPEGISPSQLKSWICGCDDCQDVCPFNKHDWSEGEEFFGLQEIEELLQPENIINAPDNVLLEKVVPKTDKHIRKENVNTLRLAAKRASEYIKNNG
ncbi:MAG: epoxyqueuosine reductase [Anaerofustis stercorihominis]|nr:epoxyqueuosine reductase [Anaerofustis stercorihominis]